MRDLTSEDKKNVNSTDSDAFCGPVKKANLWKVSDKIRAKMLMKLIPLLDFIKTRGN